MKLPDSPVYSNDYTVCTEKEIVRIEKKGIALSSCRFIDFAECARNFSLKNDSSGKCIGERDITALLFVFYTSPRPTVLRFSPKRKFLPLFAKRKAALRFQELQKQIVACGYKTYDMS